MMGSASSREASRSANRFLQSLRPADYALLQPYLSDVELVRGQSIYRQDKRIEFVYFVERGIISLVKTMEDGRTVEICAVGIESVLGWSSVLGIKGSLFDAVVQVPGEAKRIPADVFRKITEGHEPLRRRVPAYAAYTVSELAQTAACNRLHSLEERCCRWLLIAHDSARADTFLLTHEFLAMMLGVQRTAVSIAASILQKAGLIRYSRGRITITDRAGLEAMACECYGAIQDRQALLYARTGN